MPSFLYSPLLRRLSQTPEPLKDQRGKRTWIALLVVTVLTVTLTACGQNSSAQQGSSSSSSPSSPSPIRGGDLSLYIHNIFHGEGVWVGIKPDGTGSIWWDESDNTCGAAERCVGGATITAGIAPNGHLRITLDQVWFSVVAGFVDSGSLLKAPRPGESLVIAPDASSLPVTSATSPPSTFTSRPDGPKAGDWVELMPDQSAGFDVVRQKPNLRDVGHNRPVLTGYYSDGSEIRFGNGVWGAMQDFQPGQTPPTTP